MLFIIYKEHIYVTEIFLSFVRPSPFVSPAPSHQHLAWFAIEAIAIFSLFSTLFWREELPGTNVHHTGHLPVRGKLFIVQKNPYTKNRQLDSENIV